MSARDVREQKRAGDRGGRGGARTAWEARGAFSRAPEARALR